MSATALIKWCKARLPRAMSGSRALAPKGLAIAKGAPSFEIDLYNGHLSFTNPPSDLVDQDYWKGFAWDRRPFVNARSGAEFTDCPVTGRPSCTVYETGWSLPLSRRRKRTREAVLKLSVMLDRPSREERERFDDLTDEGQLREWLSLCYQSRRDSFSGLEFCVLVDGSVAVEAAESGPGKLSNPQPEEIRVLDQLVSGRTAFYVYLNPGIIECNLARTSSEVLQFRFQLRPEGQGAPSDGLKAFTLQFAQAIIASCHLLETE